MGCGFESHGAYQTFARKHNEKCFRAKTFEAGVERIWSKTPGLRKPRKDAFKRRKSDIFRGDKKGTAVRQSNPRALRRMTFACHIHDIEKC